MQKSLSKSVSQPGVSGAAALLVAAAFAGSLMAGESVPLLISSETATVDCSGRDVNVLAKQAALTFTGECKEIYFLGAGTTATVASATLVQITADDVVVSVASNVSEAYLLGKNVRLAVKNLGELNLHGENAQVDAQSIAQISAVGRGNRVSWRAGAPEINDSGGGNHFAPVP